MQQITCGQVYTVCRAKGAGSSGGCLRPFPCYCTRGYIIVMNICPNIYYVPYMAYCS